jgi:hypothetical protein
MRTMALTSLLLLAACGKSSPSFTAKGEVSVGGKPAKVTGCKQVDGNTEITLDTGHRLYWDIPKVHVIKDGKDVEVDCARDEIDAENGKGTWHATCDHPDGEIKLDLDYACPR